jgi:hypothetical protein
MAGQSFRFLHASGLQLAATVHGLADVPEHLEELLIEAPFKAAAAVFDAALREEVDFVILSGDILDPAAGGPAAVLFLQQRFEQLRAHKIAVYWAASEEDLAGDFLRQVEFPENVRIFPDDRVGRWTHFRGEDPVMSVHGRSWNAKRPLRAGEFVLEQAEGIQIVAGYGRGDVDTNARAGVHYWAMGGPTPYRKQISETEVCCPGKPQGLTPLQVGPHGCLLVTVDGEGEFRVRQLETDVVRWRREELDLSSAAAIRDIRQAFRTRVESMTTGQKRPLLISWMVTGEGRFETSLVKRRQCEEILEWLRNDFGHRNPPLWSLGVELESPKRISADWCDDDSILGDFLGALRDQLEEGETIDLGPYVSQDRLPSDVMQALTSTAGDASTASLRRAAVRAFDLLRGEDSRNRNSTHYASRTEHGGVTT